MSIFSRFFKSKQTLNTRDVLIHLNEGDYIRLYFRKPGEVGIIDGEGRSLTCSRLNEAELKKEYVQGTVARIWREKQFMNSYFIEVADVINSGQTLRKYTFLEQEVKKISKLSLPK
jgi:hypothetical protein